jgi:hypothetical protein
MDGTTIMDGMDANTTIIMTMMTISVALRLALERKLSVSVPLDVSNAEAICRASLLAKHRHYTHGGIVSVVACLRQLRAAAP